MNQKNDLNCKTDRTEFLIVILNRADFVKLSSVIEPLNPVCMCYLARWPEPGPPIWQL